MRCELNLEEVADVLGEGQEVEGVEGVGHVGEVDGEGVGFVQGEVFEGYFLGFADEGAAFEDFALHDLVFGEVVPVALFGALHVEFLFGG